MAQAPQGQGQAQPMQVDPAVQAFQDLRLELTNVTHALTAQGISGIVSKFDGNPKHFREWIKSIDKYAVLVNADDERKKLIAYQTSSAAVSGFIHRYMQANAGHTWDQMRAQLAIRFSDVTDAQMALSLLRQVKQKQGETIQNYSERILSLAEEAYNNQGGNAFERQLIDIFVDGLLNDQLKMKIFRDQPDTLQGAVVIATNEQNLRARVQLSHSYTTAKETPMEIDHSRGQKFRYKNRFNRINSAENTQSRRPVRCWNCGQEGHISRECRKKEQNRPPMGHGRPRLQHPNPAGNQEN